MNTRRAAMQALEQYEAHDLGGALNTIRDALNVRPAAEPPVALFLHRMAGAALFRLGEMDAAAAAFTAATQAQPPLMRDGHASRRLHHVHTNVQPETCLGRLLLRQGIDPGARWPDWAREADAPAPTSRERWNELCIDLNNNAVDDLDELAEYLVVGHDLSDHFPDRGSLDAVYAASAEGVDELDALIATRTIPGLRLWHFSGRYYTWLAGYIDRVAVRNGGSWREAERPADWQVEFEGKTIDPFGAAWMTLSYGIPLRNAFDV